MFIKDETIESFVMHSGLVSRNDIAESFSVAKKKGIDLGTALVQAGKMSDDDLKRVYAHSLGVPFIDLHNQDISFESLSLIPEPLARQYNIVAYNTTSAGVEVAVLNAQSLDILNQIQKESGMTFFPRFTTTSSIKRALMMYQRKLKNQLGDRIQQNIVNVCNQDASNQSISTETIVNTLLEHALLQGASDIHIEPRETMLAVRYRIIGTLRDAMMLPKESASAIATHIKSLCGMNAQTLQFPQDGRFVFSDGTRTTNIRVSIFPVSYGEKITLRIAKAGVGSFSLEGLGCDGVVLNALHGALSDRKGIILVSGTANSGITTTLYSLLDIVNTPQVAISTIEDNIEFHIPHINQTQTRKEVGLTAVEGLRSVLQQDPDVVMVDQLNSAEVVDLAVVAARTGKLVISSVHAKSAAEAFVHMINLASDLEAILAQTKIVTYQRLVKRLADSKEEYFLSEAGRKALSKIVDLDKVLEYMKREKIVGPKETWKTIPLYRAVQSPGTSGGYKGTVGIFEVITMTDGIKDVVRRGGTVQSIRKQAYKDDMLTIIEDGVIKAVQGYTTIEEIIRAS